MKEYIKPEIEILIIETEAVMDRDWELSLDYDEE